MEEKMVFKTLQQMKTDYFKDIPEKDAEAMIRKLIYTLVSR